MSICLGIAFNAISQDFTKKDSVTISNKEQNLPKKSDTTRIKLGNKGIAIIDDGKGTSVKVEDLEQNKENDREDNEVGSSDDNKDNGKKHSHFKGHWGGIEIGMNNFINKDYSMVRSAANGDQFMDLNTGRSWNVNLNLFQHSFGFGTDIFGLVTGLGFEFNDYQFDGNNNIEKDPVTSITVSKDYLNELVKTKISTGYLTLPLLLELQIPGSVKHSKRVHIAAGVIGGLKMGSHSKVEYYVNNKLQKDILKDDFNIRSLRYGFTGRIGYGALSVFANCYATSFFEKGKGPELYPFAIGLSLSL